MTGRSTCLANEEWLLKPFFQQTRTKFELINDTLLLIPKYLSELQHDLSHAIDMSEGDSARQKLKQKIYIMKQDLDELENHILQFLQPIPSRHPSSTNENNSYHYYSYNFTDPIHANIVAMHACAQIIILGILSSTTSSPPRWPCFFPIEDWHDGGLTAEMKEACKRIISASQYLSRFMIGCAYSRMVLPLQLVGQMSPSQAQRTEARTILKSWYNDTPVRGLTLLALQAIDTTCNLPISEASDDFLSHGE